MFVITENHVHVHVHALYMHVYMRMKIHVSQLLYKSGRQGPTQSPYAPFDLYSATVNVHMYSIYSICTHTHVHVHVHTCTVCTYILAVVVSIAVLFAPVRGRSQPPPW